MKHLDDYKPLVAFMANVMGQNVEVVLHDLSHADSSIVSITNGEVTGRQVGDTLFPWMFDILAENPTENTMPNIHGKGKGHQLIVTTAYFIRNDNHKIIGLICVNRDINKTLDCLSFMYREFQPVRDMMGNAFLVHKPEIEPASLHRTITPTFKTLTSNMEDVMLAMIENRSKELDVPIQYLKMSDRVTLIEKLFDDGLFAIKGSIAILAKKMNVFEPTVYRYLKQLK